MKYFAKALAQTIDEKEYTIDVILSAQTVDRQGDIVDLASMKFDNFMLNPVVLPFHDYQAMSVARVINLWIGERDGVKTLEGKIKFAVEENDKARVLFNLYKGGYMNAFSIGFSSGRAEYGENGIRTLFDCELLELSCVSVPANQFALAKSAGIDIDPLLKVMPKQEITAELKTLLISVKEIVETVSSNETDEKTPETPPEAEKKVAKNEVLPKVDMQHIKTEILRRALSKAIRSM